MKKSLVILGGGISGLSVAWNLRESDYEVHIIEKDPVVGGLSGSFIKNGYTFDYGPHCIYTKDHPEVYYQFKELLKDELLTLGEMYGSIEIVFQGRKYDYPLSMTSVLGNMKLSVLLKCSFDYFQSILKRTFYPPPNITFEDWVTSHFGKGLYDIFFGPFTEKTWGISPRELSANFASERIPKLSILKMIKELFIKEKKQTEEEIRDTGKVKFDPNLSYYPKKGAWQLGDAMKKEIQSAGGTIHTSSQVKSLIIKNEYVDQVVFEKNGVVEEIKSDFVVSTLPIPELGTVFEPLDKETKAASLKMRYRELTLLFFEINKPKVLDARLVYFHDPNVLFQRGSENKYLSDKTVPSQDKTGLTLEITNKDNLTDIEIYEESLKNLEKLHLLRKQDVEAYHIVRQPYAYPIYDVNYKNNLDIFMKSISKYKNLIPSGRQALFRYIDQDLCMKMGLVISQYLQGDIPWEGLDDIVADWS